VKFNVRNKVGDKMIEYLAQNEGPITYQLIFKDTGISEKTYKQLENRIKKYKDITVLTHVPVANEVIIIVNKKCKDDECRKNEAEDFIKYYDEILSKITIK
jgi:P2-related tail formation protein